MNAAERLREALFWQREIEKDIRQSAPHPDTAEAGISVLATVFDAARTIALPILEGNPIRRRIGEILVKHFYPPSPVAFVDATDEILAAISTPTPVEEL